MLPGPALSAVLPGATASTFAPLAWAHVGLEVTPANWWTVWNLDPVLLGNLLVLSVLFTRGLARMAERFPDRVRATARSGAFALGVLAVVVALVSPLDALSEQLSWAHMIQHTVLMLVAAPLLVLSAPGLPLLWSLPLPWRLRLSRWRRRPAWQTLRGLLWHPLAVWLLHGLALWLWHLPVLYLAALAHPIVHDVQHLSFFVTACLFWRVLLDPFSRRRIDRGAAVLSLFTTSLHATALGAFMALSPRVWYPAYEGRTLAWGVTALEDQQLAGLIMWMPACSVYAVLAAILLGLWLEESRVARPRLEGRGA